MISHDVADVPWYTAGWRRSIQLHHSTNLFVNANNLTWMLRSIAEHWMLRSIAGYFPWIKKSASKNGNCSGTKIIIVNLIYKMFGFSAGFFEPKFDMCFCSKCHAKRKDDETYSRGIPPKTYALPIGWYRFGLKYVNYSNNHRHNFWQRGCKSRRQEISSPYYTWNHLHNLHNISQSGDLPIWF